ncbi:MAG: GvpL/GvpF family gas vesicle protein [Acidobacteriota bacterium]
MSPATYVYCLISAAGVPALGRVPAGLTGTGPVRLLDVDGHDPAAPTARAGRRSGRRGGGSSQWLAVADAPLPQYGDAAINRRLADLDWVSRAAIAHEAVIEAFIEAPAVLPMKLFTIFNSDVRALDHLRRDRRRIAALLERVDGHHEWGVRVVLDPAYRPPAGGRAAARAVSAPGLAYLALKKAQRDQASELVNRARTTVADLDDRLRARASMSSRRPATELSAKGGLLLLDAAFLVQRSRSAQFRALVERQSKRLATHGYQVSMTGPWPPYTFISD